MIDHMSSNAIWDTNFITIGALRCIFSLLDLIFTFSPASQLKQELHKVGISLYRGSQTNFPSDFQRTASSYLYSNLRVFHKNHCFLHQVEQFSIHLMHQKKCLNVKGLFDLDNYVFYQVNERWLDFERIFFNWNVFFQVISAIIAYIIFFLQFKTQAK